MNQVRTALGGVQYQARRRRLELLLEQAQQSSGERAVWEKVLQDHPVFQRAVHQAVERMRDDLMSEARRSILAEEVGHRDHIRQLEQEEAAHCRALEHLRGVTQQATAALARIRQTRDGLPAGPNDGTGGTGAKERTVIELSSPRQAMEHLTGNLERLGLRPTSAKLVTRTAFTAASLGQILFVRGSLALPVADTVATSLAGAGLKRVTVKNQGAGQLDDFDSDPDSEARGLLLDGINRLDGATAGSELFRLSRDRALGLAGWPPTPVVVATLVEGPHSPAADACLLAHGPVLAVDALAWNDTGAATGAVPAECELTAWDVPGSSGDATHLIELIEDLIPLPQRLWQRNVHAAARRLTALAERGCSNDPTALLLFAWVLPWLAAQGSLRVDRIRDRFPEAAGEEHVMRLLRFHAVHRPSHERP